MIIKSILTITVDSENGFVKIENDSLFTVEICVVPKNNKRKVHAQMIISPKKFCLIDKVTEFNLKDYYMRFV